MCLPVAVLNMYRSLVYSFSLTASHFVSSLTSSALFQPVPLVRYLFSFPCYGHRSRKSDCEPTVYSIIEP
ncbi:hypothetical protein BJX62DRAFT_197156 [Aspergillus germanicus]